MMKNIKEKIIKNSSIFVFCTTLFVISIASILKKDNYFSETENRILKQKPNLSLQNIIKGTYEKEYEEYLADQFLSRNQWIAWKTRIDHNILQKQEVNGVYFAKDNYYIERHKPEEFQNETKEKNIQYLLQFIEKYQRIVGKDKIKFLLIPTASYVLKEKLPLFAPEDGQEELFEEIEREIAKENYISVSSDLREHREEEIYYRTDHHWTTLGAYYGYLSWARETNREAWGEEKFKKEIVSDNFLGTIQSKINIKMQPDHIILYQPIEEISYQMRTNLENTAKTTIYDLEKLNTKDKYSVFLGGNNALTEIGNKNLKQERLLVIKDSFGNSIAPFLINHYEKTYFIDFRYFNGSLESFIEENKITEICILYNTVNFTSDRYFGKLLH